MGSPWKHPTLRWWRWGVAVALVLALALPAGAELLRKRRVDNLLDLGVSSPLLTRYGIPRLPAGTIQHRVAICQNTDLAFVGRVTELESYLVDAHPVPLKEDAWVGESPRVKEPFRMLKAPRSKRVRPETKATFLVEEKVHGEVGDTFSFTMRVGMVGQYWHGDSYVPRMEEGERYLLLLIDHPNFGWVILGAGQGAVGLDPSAELPPTPGLQVLWEDVCADSELMPKQNLPEGL
ncbi:MAG TPA: hypothetical protein PLA94_26585 [Myxococcota bacterium]|nr:hypothetical protein [Myxococcota bacterium]